MAVVLAWHTPEPDWAGTWKGTLVNHPVRPKARSVETTMEIGAFPKADNECSIWKSTFNVPGKPDVVKDYKLCRANEEDLYFEQGEGVKLTSRWVGELLVTSYKANTMIFFQTVRLRGDLLEQEIFVAHDVPASKGPAPTVMEGTTVQRIVLRRVSK